MQNISTEKAHFGTNIKSKLHTSEVLNCKSWGTGKKQENKRWSKRGHLELWIKALNVSGNLSFKCSESATLKMLTDECLITQEYKYVKR